MCGQRRHAEDPPADTGIRWAYRRYAHLLCRCHGADKGMARPALPVYRHGLEPETAGIKESLVHLHAEPAGCPALRDPDCNIHAVVGLTGLSVKDHLMAYDLDAGIKPPVTEKKEFMEKAYRIGKELLGLGQAPKYSGASEIINFM